MGTRKDLENDRYRETVFDGIWDSKWDPSDWDAPKDDDGKAPWERRKKDEETW
jgi:hypothetical protein